MDDVVLRTLHLCSGYGGFELALKLAGVPSRTVAHVERDAYAASTLVARMEDEALDLAPVWSDLTTFDCRAWRGRVDLITAGFPCQPFSRAGQQLGIEDDRWLWPDIARVVGEVGPRLVLLENVTPLVRHGLAFVLDDLARLGFDAEWGDLSAREIGATHIRKRFWLMAHSHRPRRQGAPDVSSELKHALDGGTSLGDPGGTGGPAIAGSTLGDEGTDGSYRRDFAHGSVEDVADAQGDGLPRRWSSHAGGRPAPWSRCHPQGRRDDAWPPARDDDDGWRRWIADGGPEPSVRRGADGRPAELADSLHLGGNGLVPEVAARALVVLADRLGVDLWERSMTDSVPLLNGSGT